MDLVTQLVHSTVRIKTLSPDGNGSGTGFIVSFPVEGIDGQFLFLITNKHVIAGATQAEVSVTQFKRGTDEPDYGNIKTFSMPGEGQWITHPDPDVDLAMLPAHYFWSAMMAEDNLPALVPIPYRAFATPEIESGLTAVESVLMVGYPRGIADEVNNLPVSRRGITATPLAIDFEGKSQFLIDCAVFPGSSGSPVFLYDTSGFLTADGSWHIGITPRCYLLGVLWGGPTTVGHGVVEAVPVPTSETLVAKTQMLMNLGYCVKAREIAWFAEEWQRRVAGSAGSEPA